MKQRSISSFFASKPKATVTSPRKGTAAAGAAETDKRSPPKKSPSKRSPAKRSTTNLAGPAPVAEDAAAAEPLPEQQQQQQEQVTDRPTAPSGEDSVGLRIRVYWKGDRAWYSGHIAAYSKGRHQVMYDDGDEEWLDLARQRHELLPHSSNDSATGSAGGGGKSVARAAKAGTRRSAARRRAVLASDSEEDAAGAESGSNGGSDDSDFDAADCDDDDDDAVMEDLEAEQDSDEGSDQDSDDASDQDSDGKRPGGGRKRKLAPSKAPRKRGGAAGRAAAAAAVAGADEGSPGALTTPAAGITASQRPLGAGAAPPPSSAGRTPMERFRCGGSGPCPAGFPALTPPVTAAKAGIDGATPAAKVGLFRGQGDADPVGATPSQATPCGSGGTAMSLLATPRSAEARATLQSALDVTPGGPAHGGAAAEPQVVLGIPGLGAGAAGADAARFAARMAERFPFLHPKRIRDKAGRRPQDQEYDPRTLAIPNATAWFKEMKVSEAQQQWWSFKAANFDSVLLFKVGKFYEMFEMDAFVGVEVLGLSYMRGEQPHAGFPEAAYRGMAEQLARAGYRVVVIEQTETPEQLKARNAARKPGAKAATVVERQAVTVLSRGTLLDPEMVSTHPDAAYVLAVAELQCDSGGDAPFIGACAFDAAAGQMLLGGWRDDEVRLRLRTQLTGLRPVEVVLPRGGTTSATTSRLVRCGGSRGAPPSINELPAAEARPEAGEEAIDRVYAGAAEPPVLLRELRAAAAAGGESGAAARAALAAYGLMASFLAANMLGDALLPHARVTELCEGARGSDEPVCMELNGAALEGLEVLENALGGPQGSLLGLLDHCVTPFGRRRLRRWLTRPLYRAADIIARQDAVEELLGDAATAVCAARRALAGCSDLERCISRMAASVGGCAAAAGNGGFGREAANVVLYEDVARRRVRVLVGAMRDLRALRDALAAFTQVELRSELLGALTEEQRWSDFSTRLDDLAAAAEWEQAEREGVVRPSRAGVDPAYDAAQAALRASDEDLKAYLGRVQRSLDCRAVSFTSLHKESHVLEVPEAAAGSMPPEYALVGHRKGYKRYMTPELKRLVAARSAAEEDRERVQAGVLQALERLFVSHAELWSSAVEAVAVLDCIMALAGAATAADGELCRPKLLPPAADGRGVLRARALRHPAGLGGSGCGAFVPNDVTLGDDGPGFLLLTGPNMGGKSTLLRQVCLAAVLAQVGALVPAESLELTPMDGVYVRMGARDAILAGQSTFFIEMAETAAMLARAGPRSLVALDELGRGTATLDGAAIAAAVLEQLLTGSRCLGLFATHYHQLAAAHTADPGVAIMHMACAVAEPEQDEEGGGEAGAVAEVTFLYKLTPGACPKSYGTNVARLAGLPPSVLARAAEMSASREALAAGVALADPPTPGGGTDAGAARDQEAACVGGDAPATAGGAGELKDLARAVATQLAALKAAAVGGVPGPLLFKQLGELQRRAAAACQ